MVKTLLDSEIWLKPPYYLKIYLFLKAIIGSKKKIKSSYEEIQKGTSWRIGFRTEQLSKDEIFNCLEFLKEDNRISMKAITNEGKTIEISLNESNKTEQIKKRNAIIYLYAEIKNINLDDKLKRQSFFKRNLRAGKLLVPYELEKIRAVMEWLNINSNFKWTLETCSKYIDEKDLERLSPNQKITKI